jgi:PelA/Pel-15E family pectate lyase
MTVDKASCSITRILFINILILSLNTSITAQASSGVRWYDCLKQNSTWYSTAEAIRIADNLFLYQNNSGGWFKNIDMAKELSDRETKKIIAQKDSEGSTIDNGSTYTQLRFLAKVYNAVKIERFKDSFMKGFDYLIKAQYKNGGWPQFYPLIKGYYTHITFNDDAMIGVMNLLKDIVEKKPDFEFVDKERTLKAKTAIKKGVECILKCQIVIDGKPTLWCAQHDESTFEPAKARTYELPSFSGAESVGLVEFLMGIKNPSQKIIDAIQSAVEWLDKLKIEGIKQTFEPDKKVPHGRNKIVVKDPSAWPMWARFYEIKTKKPIFCSRDGIIHYDISEISSERRNGYNWLGYWGQNLLTEEYPKWQKQYAPLNNVLVKNK